MSTISSGTTSTTTLVHSGDTTGSLVFKTNDTGSGGTTAVTIDTSQNVGIGTTPRAKLEISKSSDSASPSRTPADYSILFTAAQSNTYNNGIGVTEGTYVSSAITPIDTGSGGAQGWAFITGNNTSIAEAMRIDSSGNLLVGTTTVYNGAKATFEYGGSVASFKQTASGGYVANYWATVNSGNYYYSVFYAAGTQVGSITSTSSTTSYVTTSDYRLKKDIQPMQNALAKISKLKPVIYKWKADDSDGEGFIAHELAEICPDAVSGEKDAVNEDGSIKPQGIDTSFLVATLVASIQELKAIVDAQAVTLATQATEIAELKAKVG